MKHKWPYHTWFFNWLEKMNTKFGNWLWAKRWRNFKKNFNKDYDK